MRANSFCISCLVRRQEERIRNFSDEEKKTEYMREVLKLISTDDSGLSAPTLIRDMTEIYRRYWGDPRDMEKEKREFNEFLLDMEEQLEAAVRRENDPLEAALNYARTGNYIDFTTVKDVSKKGLLELFERQSEKPLDAGEYACFLDDLAKAKSLVYLTDNCGEIVLDKIVIRILQERYPRLDILVLVRGAAVANDADLPAAREVGLDRLVPVVGNGSDIAGTDLQDLSWEARRAVEQADLILSKGQGNFETLHGCGLNIYYLFLCKCEWFLRRFRAKPLEGMFVNERRI